MKGVKSTTKKNGNQKEGHQTHYSEIQEWWLIQMKSDEIGWKTKFTDNFRSNFRALLQVGFLIKFELFIFILVFPFKFSKTWIPLWVESRANGPIATNPVSHSRFPTPRWSINLYIKNSTNKAGYFNNTLDLFLSFLLTKFLILHIIF